MAKIAFVFSGQGAQYSGMGRDLYENIPAARAVFEQAATIRADICELCFTAAAEQLKQTVNAQPGIYCVDLAAARALQAAGVEPSMLAGFSLGELAALTFGGSMSDEDGFKLVCERGRFMQASGDNNPSVMVAVLKLTSAVVDELAQGYSQVYPVNYNGPGQVVVAGEATQVEEFQAAVKEVGGRCMPLQVSGGFHSPFMAEAAAGFQQALENYMIGLPQIPVYANYTAEPYSGSAKQLLAQQIINPVRWQNTVEAMIAAGADVFVEVGPGKTLCNLIKKINADVAVYNVEDCESLDRTLKGLAIC